MSSSPHRHAHYFLLATILLDSVGFGIVLPVLPSLIIELSGEGLSEAARYSGWMLTLFAVLNFFAMPILGNLSDRFGRRPILLLSLATLGLNTLMMGLATSLPMLFVSRALAGIGSASFSTANAYIADITPPEERAQRFGLIGAAFGLGFILGPAIGGQLSTFGARAPFYVAAAVALANVIYGFWVVPESLTAEHRRHFEWRRANPLGSLFALRRYPAVANLALVVVLYQLAFQSLPSTWNFFVMHQFHWSAAEVGYSLAFTGSLMVVVQALLVGRVIPRLGERSSATLGIALSIVGYLGYCMSLSSWMLYVAMVFAAASGLVTPSLNAIMTRQVGPSAQGELQGAIGCLVSMTAIVGPPLMTQLFAHFSSATAPIQFAGAPFLAAAGLLLLALVWLRLVQKAGANAAEPVVDAASGP